MGKLRDNDTTVKSFNKNNAAYDPEGTGTESLETIEEAIHYNQWIADKFKPYLGTRNMELGAGLGTISEILLQEHAIKLCELSESNRSALTERFSANTHCTGIESDLLENKEWDSLDSVYSSNVLEHIENDLHIIEHSLKLLQPGGHFAALVPAGKWLMSDFDRMIGHYRRYSKYDKKRIADFLAYRQIRAKITEFRYFNPVGALGWYIKMVVLKNTRVKKSDAMVMDRLITVLSLLDHVPFPFGQNCFFVIRKNG